jgi:hypothetical protein
LEIIAQVCGSSIKTGLTARANRGSGLISKLEWKDGSGQANPSLSFVYRPEEKSPAALPGLRFKAADVVLRGAAVYAQTLNNIRHPLR